MVSRQDHISTRAPGLSIENLTNMSFKGGESISQNENRYPLWYWRKRLGISQEAVAKRCGVNRSAVSLWESGRYAPRKRHWPVLKEILKISDEQLMASLEEGRKQYASGEAGER